MTMSPAGTATPPLVLRQRFEHAGRSLGFLLIGVGLGVLDLVALPTALVGGAAALRRLLELERTVANRLLRARIPALPPVGTDEPIAWRTVAFLVLKLPAAVIALCVCAVPAALAAFLLMHAGEGFAGSSSYLGPWLLDWTVATPLVVLVAPAVVLLAATAEGVGAVALGVTRRGLTSRAADAVPVREALAERLGDRSLAVAYWLPERELFVDERGHPVELPATGSGRSWTAVEHAGRRVAAIIHDAELEARPELVEAAAAGAVLALQNEQLKADLRARLEELRASRKRIVEASVDARKRLERDLHDGAQQQLVSLSLDLQLLETRVGDGEARRQLAGSRAKLDEAIVELRELARGIHPALLTDRGLKPALEALARRAPVPVGLKAQLPHRPPAAVEAAVYFLVSEALANVAKYASAGGVEVTLTGGENIVTVVVEDDGIGGADPSQGSGLRGLSDRIAALDGRLQIDSSPGTGTRLTASIPIEPSAASEA